MGLATRRSPHITIKIELRFFSSISKDQVKLLICKICHNFRGKYGQNLVEYLNPFHVSVPSLRKAFRSIPSEVFLRKGVLKICSKFSREHGCQRLISIKLLCTSARLFSCKFVAYFHNTFFSEHLWVPASQLSFSDIFRGYRNGTLA